MYKSKKGCVMTKKKLWEQIDHILREDWNPIGINTREVKDEYSGYVSSILKLLDQDADVQKIATLLLHHANINMGLSTGLDEHILVAKKIKLLIL